MQGQFLTPCRCSWSLSTFNLSRYKVAEPFAKLMHRLWCVAARNSLILVDLRGHVWMPTSSVDATNGPISCRELSTIERSISSEDLGVVAGCNARAEREILSMSTVDLNCVTKGAYYMYCIDNRKLAWEVAYVPSCVVFYAEDLSVAIGTVFEADVMLQIWYKPNQECEYHRLM